MGRWALPLLGLLLTAPVHPTAAVKLTRETLTFGHAVKNGALPPVNASDAETTTFEHTCVTPPCTINQLHVPSIYPKNKADWAWQNGVIRFYVDGEADASIQLKLLELSWVSEYASPAHSSLKPGASGGQYDNRGLPWGIADFGHTASSGGVSSTIRIPFGKSVRVTIQAPPNTFTTSVYWMIVSEAISPCSFGQSDETLDPPRGRNFAGSRNRELCGHPWRAGATSVSSPEGAQGQHEPLIRRAGHAGTGTLWYLRCPCGYVWSLRLCDV